MFGCVFVGFSWNLFFAKLGNKDCNFVLPQARNSLEKKFNKFCRNCFHILLLHRRETKLKKLHKIINKIWKGNGI
jgi:hypothetical protein